MYKSDNRESFNKHALKSAIMASLAAAAVVLGPIAVCEVADIVKKADIEKQNLAKQGDVASACSGWSPNRSVQYKTAKGGTVTLTCN